MFGAEIERIHVAEVAIADLLAVNVKIETIVRHIVAPQLNREVIRPLRINVHGESGAAALPIGFLIRRELRQKAPRRFAERADDGVGTCADEIVRRFGRRVAEFETVEQRRRFRRKSGVV